MKKILIISPYFPFPARDGGKVRLYNLIKHLSKENKVYLLAYIEPAADKNCVALAKEFCTEVFPVLREETAKHPYSVSLLLCSCTSYISFIPTSVPPAVRFR